MINRELAEVIAQEVQPRIIDLIFDGDLWQAQAALERLLALVDKTSCPVCTALYRGVESVYHQKRDFVDYTGGYVPPLK